MRGRSYMPADEDTVSSIQIDEYFERTGMLDNWTLARVNRLCRLLSATPFELGKLCAVSFKEMHRYINSESFPGPVRLHFALLESWAIEHRRGAKTTAAIPVHLVGEKKVA